MAATMIRSSRLLLPSVRLRMSGVGAPGRYASTSSNNSVGRMITAGTIFGPVPLRRRFMTQALVGSGRRRGGTTARTKHRSFSSPGGKPEDPGEASSSAAGKTFWQRFLEPKPMPERHTAAWYREMLLICTVFGITGSSTMILVRPAVSEVLGIKGSFRDGPWTYRICSLVIMTPIYATLLVGIGTLFGRHAYFRHFSVKIFSRFGIPPEALDANFHQTKKTFRKW